MAHRHRPRGTRLLATAAVATTLALGLLQAPASHADDGNDVGAQATINVGDTCDEAGIRDCLLLHYNSYPAGSAPNSACHASNRNLGNHRGQEDGSNYLAYVFRTGYGPGCHNESGYNERLVNNAASFNNRDCANFQIYAGTFATGHSRMAYHNTIGQMGTDLKNNNESHYARSGC
ncbi:hypothetical protein [Streptomyces litchfieldiae]|uniref:Uncharacterized protein n=1 Tax=Streptomyces litchfieldiae TaxID=3075543 RepID=A0ABU2MT15_9ACTN|nr:hypothetical protein [Streptomyces sp. DSM 44938]MDT0344547.1 hypothetical protein [Streptomyces sp. DSM 44938]